MSDGASAAVPVGTIWHVQLAEAPVLIGPQVPAEFSRVGPEAEAKLARAMGLADPAEVSRRFEGGGRCYAARAQGDIAAYGWVSFGEETVGGLGLRVRLLEGEAYIWDCVTLPAFRRRGLYAALLGRIVAGLRDDGFRGAWIGADYDNRPSHAGIARAGFAVVADLLAALPAPGERRRRGWLTARPGVSEAELAEARRAYLGGCNEVWLFGQDG